MKRSGWGEADIVEYEQIVFAFCLLVPSVIALRKLLPGYDSVIISALSPFRLLMAILLLTIPVQAKDVAFQIIDWPTTDNPVLRFTFDKLKQLDGSSRMRGYVMNVSAQNLSAQLIPGARFSVYLFDKNKVRVGGRLHHIEQCWPQRDSEGAVHRHDLWCTCVSIHSEHSSKPQNHFTHCELDSTGCNITRG